MTIVAPVALLCVIVTASGDAVAVGSGKTLTWPGGGRGDVRFEGEAHAEKGYACKDCHPRLFSMKYGDAAMTMSALDSGRFCGACHNGTMAFGTKDPKKCHEYHREGKHGKHREHENGKQRHGD